MALGRYNGSRGKPPYPNAVFAAAKNWEYRDLSPAESSPAPAKPADKASAGPS